MPAKVLPWFWFFLGIHSTIHTANIGAIPHTGYTSHPKVRRTASHWNWFSCAESHEGGSLFLVSTSCSATAASHMKQPACHKKRAHTTKAASDSAQIHSQRSHITIKLRGYLTKPNQTHGCRKILRKSITAGH